MNTENSILDYRWCDPMGKMKEKSLPHNFENSVHLVEEEREHLENRGYRK